jgi:hypothetical protein
MLARGVGTLCSPSPCNIRETFIWCPGPPTFKQFGLSPSPCRFWLRARQSTCLHGTVTSVHEHANELVCTAQSHRFIRLNWGCPLLHCIVCRYHPDFPSDVVLTLAAVGARITLQSNTGVSDCLTSHAGFCLCGLTACPHTCKTCKTAV